MALQTPYYKPSLPFTGPIYGGLRDGQTILVTGSILPSCKRFQVDLQCGSCQSPRSDIAFHFNPRFDENCVVWNYLERGAWQQEDRKCNLPFRKGHAFEIRFLVNSSSYKVFVDGKHYLEFKHKIPFSRVNTIGVSGGLDVAAISFQGPAVPDVWPARTVQMAYSSFPTNPAFPTGPCFPTGPAFPTGPSFPTGPAFPTGPCFPTGPSFPTGPTYLAVPYRARIYGGLFPSKSIKVSGNSPPNAIKFHINLKAGRNTVFHLNPRFNEKVMVRNSKFNDNWGSEERHLPAGMPLSCGQAFTIWILCEAHCFRVAVNGQHQFDYNHRATNLQQIDQLEVEGDVTLTDVQV